MYQILAYPDNKYDTVLGKEKYDDIDEAVRNAIELYGSAFLIVRVVDWEVQTKAVEV